jgi:UDP:flavonoid glycosyltransferase YjiC (YdhE family)
VARARSELERVLGDPSIADAARCLAQAMAAMPEPEEVAHQLERRYG